MFYDWAYCISKSMFKSKSELDSLFGDNEMIAGLVIAICATLYDNGIRHIHVGGLMRLLGVEHNKAKLHDDEVFNLPDDFYDQIESMGFEKIDDSQLTIPTNTIIH